MAFPFRLGEERVGQSEFSGLPLDEQSFIQRLSGVMSARYWEAYRSLRARRFSVREAAAGAWMAAGFKGRGGKTHQQMADLLGISRRTFIRLVQDQSLQTTALGLQMEWLNERVPSVDEALYRKAEAGDVTAIKLFYSRSRVILSEADIAAGQANWMDALRAAKEEEDTGAGAQE